MKIREHYTYYIDEYKTFNAYIKEFLHIIENKKILKFVSSSGLNHYATNGAEKYYETDSPNYILFEDDIVLKFNYNIFSIIDVKITTLKALSNPEIEIINNENSFDFDCYGQTIEDYELNRFSDEYIIEPCNDTIRPEGGDYFKELIFHLSNNKKICICAENADTDGYCDIWVENNNLKGIFNGSPHKAWWN